MFTKTTGIPTLYMYMLKVQFGDISIFDVTVEFGVSAKIGVHGPNNFSDEFLETSPSKYC